MELVVLNTPLFVTGLSTDLTSNVKQSHSTFQRTPSVRSNGKSSWSRFTSCNDFAQSSCGIDFITSLELLNHLVNLKSPQVSSSQSSEASLMAASSVGTDIRQSST